MRTYTLEIIGITVTVDDEGNWKVIDNPKQLDGEGLLELLEDVELGVYPPPTFPRGMHYVAGAIEKMEAKLLKVEPPFEYDDDPNIVY